MFAVNDFNIFTPVWKLPRELHAQNFGSWSQIKELYVQDSGTWTKVWNENNWGTAGNVHPYWLSSQNYSFSKTDDFLSFNTIDSATPKGFYSYPSSGRLRLEIGTDNFIWLESAMPLSVSPGQTYKQSVFVDSRTVGTRMSLRTPSNSTFEETWKNGSGRTDHYSTLISASAGTTVEHTFTVPAGHNFIRPYIFIDTTVATRPERYTFGSWIIERMS